jgi:hypothetical protein
MWQKGLSDDAPEDKRSAQSLRPITHVSGYHNHQDGATLLEIRTFLDLAEPV